ncbi:hypothetical protein ABZ319_04035 [Nocardia sp. NPDC005978]|uniref:hypothetical protein n=1 Tax=Nocardia sp. NPDC005978 TaxID=3156725 RepID=UPI0033B47E80
MVSRTEENDVDLDTLGTRTDLHHRAKPLVAPVGASAGLKKVIAAAEAARLLAVNILGRGPTCPPPRRTQPYLVPPSLPESGSSGQVVEKYTQTLDGLAGRIVTLEQLDDQVAAATLVVGSGRVKALAAVNSIFTTLQHKFDLAQKGADPKTKRLSAAQESTLLAEISDAIQAAFEHIRKVLRVNEEMAGGAGSGTATPSGTGGEAGGGGGGLDIGSILQGVLGLAVPMLAMLPTLLPDNSQQEKSDQERSNEGADTDKRQSVDPRPSSPPASAPDPVAPPQPVLSADSAPPVLVPSTVDAPPAQENSAPAVTSPGSVAPAAPGLPSDRKRPPAVTSPDESVQEPEESLVPDQGGV